MNELEDRLREHFPEVYQLIQLSRADPHFWDVLTVMQEMSRDKESGYVRISYAGGDITTVIKLLDILARKKLTGIKR